MEINYIKTIGFRKFSKELVVPLYRTTNIYGKNRSGKSNILYAIINCILGTNLSGDEKTCLINKKSDVSYTELHFTDENGIKHVLVRIKHKYDTSKNSIILDGKQITQAKLLSFYKDKKLFLSIINPLYFINKKPAEQKIMLDECLSNIKPKAIFDTLDRKQQEYLIKKYYHDEKQFEELSILEQEDFINMNMVDICMNVAYNQLSKDEQNVLECIPNDIPTFISELNEDIKRTETDISVLDGKIEYTENIVNTEIPKLKLFEKEEELSLARQEFAQLTTNREITKKENQKQVIDNIEADILNKETELEELRKAMKTDKQKYLSIKNEKDSICPVCEQHIQGVSRSKTIINMKNELMSSYEKSNTLELQLKDLKMKLAIEKCNYHALEGNTVVKNSERINVVQEEIKRLEAEKLEIERFNHEIAIKKDTIKKAKSEIMEFSAKKDVYVKNIEQIKKAKQIAQKLYVMYIEEKMKLAKQHLKDVDIQFYSVLKTTGEIKEDFIITYQKRPLSDLSRSETIATSLEFANMFNQICNVKFPIFIDDGECCADYDFIKQYSNNTQLMVSQVKKGTRLTIADYNSNNCTIIKPVINGYRILKIYKDVANIKEAA